jgi:hypothetical protein
MKAVTRPFPLLAAGAVLLAAANAGAQPRVTLKLDQVTLPQALQALQRESGWEFKLERGFVLDLPADPQAERSSFAWEEKPIGVVCRELAAAFHLTAQKSPLQGGSPRQVEFLAALPPPPKPLLTVTRDGFQIRLSEVTQDATARQELGGNAPPVVVRSAGLDLTVRAPDGDPDRIFSIQNLQIETDRGPADLETDDLRHNDGDTGAPDEWTAHVRISRLPPRATEIVRVTGDLAIYPAPPSTSVRLPLSGARPAFPTGLDPITLRLNDLQIQEGHIRINVEAVWGTNVLGLGPNGVDWTLPVATTQSGRIYPLTGPRNTAVENGVRRMTLRLGTLLPRPDDQPVYILWDVRRPLEEPERLSFRFRRFPLPRLPLDAPAKPAPGGAS